MTLTVTQQQDSDTRIQVIGYVHGHAVTAADGMPQLIGCPQRVGIFDTQAQADAAAKTWVASTVQNNVREGEDVVNVWQHQRLIRADALIDENGPIAGPDRRPRLFVHGLTLPMSIRVEGLYYDA